MKYAVIIPVRNEEESLGQVIDSLRQQLPADRFLICIGLNGTTDSSHKVVVSSGADFIGDTDSKGYGYGCTIAIEAIDDSVPIAAYIFFAGDGANDPADISRLVEIHETRKVNFVMGLRRFDLGTWRNEFGRALPNLLLGLGAFCLSGRFFHDLGPLRLIEKDLFDRLDLREMVWGWTMEAQIKALRMGEKITTIPVVERPRIAGQQKVSGVSLWQSLKIGAAIFAAGVRARFS